MADDKRIVNCTRCENTPLRFAGTKEFHEGSKWAEVFLGILGENRLFLDVYYCPKCGHVELFMKQFEEDTGARRNVLGDALL